MHKNAGGLWHPDYIDQIWQAQRTAEIITLGGVFYNYSRLKDNAVTGGLVTISSSKIKDKYVNGVWQNPYQQQTTFAMAPAINHYAGRFFSVVMPSNLWLTNNASNVQGIGVDFNDGHGYRNITAGQSVFISYADTGTKAWVFRLTLTNGSKLYSHSDVYITPEPWNNHYAPFDTSRNRYVLYGYSPTDPTPISITADEAYNGVKAQGYMTINYASPTRKLTRPLIVAEGFDPGTVTNPEEKYGDMTFSNFANAVENSGSYNLQILLQNTYGIQQKYDIIYVDWKNGVDYMERNALLLEKVIKWVNSQKAADGCTTPNVVLGQSMGGIIARYALKDMENKQLNGGPAHQTSLYINWDGPQQGANVPLAYQHLGRHANSLYMQTNVPILLGSISPTIALTTSNQLNLSDFPGARELLINRIDANHNLENSYHDAWIAKLKAMGYPQQCRKISVSNGSECGLDQGFQPGASLLSLNGSVNTRFLSDLITSFFPFTSSALISILLNKPGFAFLGILPGKSTLNSQFELNAAPSSAGQRIYLGKITYTKKLLWLINITVTYTNQSYYSQSSVLPIDNTEGGMYDVSGITAGATGLNSSTLPDIAQWFIKYNVTATSIPQFNFVPTTSTLDIGESKTKLTMANYTAKYVGSLPPAAPYNTPFDNFITSYDEGAQTLAGTPSNNESHLQIAYRNGNWVANELNKLINPTGWIYPKYNCTDLCNSLTISGASNLCGTSDYTINVKDPTSFVLWSASPEGIVSIPNYGQSVAVTPLASGNVTLTATVTNANCGDNQNFSQKTIYVGLPTISCYRSSYPVSTVLVPSLPSLPPQLLNNYPTVNEACASESVPKGYYIPNAGFGIYPQIVGATTCKWHLVSASAPQHLIYKQVGNNIEIAMQGVGENAVFSVSSSNSCGTTTVKYKFQTAHCAAAPTNAPVLHAFAISPNPATNNINVSVGGKSANTSTVDRSSVVPLATAIPQSDNNLVITEVKIYDNMQILKKVMTIGNSKNANVNIAGLTPGIYFVKITGSNNYSETQTIIVH